MPVGKGEKVVVVLLGEHDGQVSLVLPVLTDATCILPVCLLGETLHKKRFLYKKTIIHYSGFCPRYAPVGCAHPLSGLIITWFETSL